MVIFALLFWDFEQNCFWLLAEKLWHCRQNCNYVYVARFRRKRFFWKYSTFHIDVGFRPNFFSFRWQLFVRGIKKAMNVPEKEFWDKILISEEFQLKKQFHSLSKNFWTFSWHLFCGLVRTYFQMSRRSFWRKKVLIRNFSWLTAFANWAKIFVILIRIFRWGCQNRTLCASEIFFTKKSVLKKPISKSFSVFRLQFSSFEAKVFWQVYQFCIQFVWRKLSRESFAGTLSHCFLDFYAFLFSVKLCRFLLAVLSELNSIFPQDCLHGKLFLWKKKHFKLYFNL